MNEAIGNRLAVLMSFSGQGGVERMVLKLIGEFAASGRAVDLVAIRGQNLVVGQVPDSVRVVDLGVRHTGLALCSIAAYLRRERPAAILCAKDRAIRAAVLGRAISRQPTRLVGRLGTNLSESLKGRSAVTRALRVWPMRHIYRHVDAVVAISQGVADDTARLTGLDSSRIRVIPNPVVSDELYDAARSDPGEPWFAEAPPVILGVGRLTKQKDFSTLVRAFAKLRGQRACRLIILGDGREGPELERLAAELGVRPDVKFPGFVDNPWSWMARSQLFVLSSRWEGLGNVLVEALALGIPSVSTDCPSGPGEIMAQGRFGPLAPVGDVDALADAMARTLDAPLPPATLRLAADPYQLRPSARRYLDVLGIGTVRSECPVP